MKTGDVVATEDRKFTQSTVGTRIVVLLQEGNVIFLVIVGFCFLTR